MKTPAIAVLSLFTLTAAFADQAATPFNGKDLLNWNFKEKKTKEGKNVSPKWVIGIPKLGENPKVLSVEPGEGAMVNAVAHHGESVDIYSQEKFGGARIEVELMVPQGSNSGVYVMGEYEVQVLDSYGKDKMGPGDMGAVYGAKPARVNACKKPGEWQKYVIEYQAPKFDATGKKTANFKFLKIELNGQILHENLELPGPTPTGVSGKEASAGPIMFQGDHGGVAFRNLKITPLNP